MSSMKANQLVPSKVGKRIDTRLLGLANAKLRFEFGLRSMFSIGRK